MGIGDIRDGMTVTVDQLNDLFGADQMGAHQKLVGTGLTVRGKVSKVFVRDHIDVRYLVLESMRSNEAWSVRCGFEKADATGLTRVQEGQDVQVSGRYDGFSKNIILKECRLAG